MGKVCAQLEAEPTTLGGENRNLQLTRKKRRIDRIGSRQVLCGIGQFQVCYLGRDLSGSG